MPDEQHRRPGPLGHPRQRCQRSAHVLVLVGVGVARQEGHQRVDDDELRGHALDPRLDDRYILGDGQVALVALVPDRDGGEGENPRGVAARRVEPGPDGVGQAVLGVHQHHARRLARLAVGEPAPDRQPRREVRGDYALAVAGVAVDDGDLPERDAPIPQPLDLLRLHVRKDRAERSASVALAGIQADLPQHAPRYAAHAPLLFA